MQLGVQEGSVTPEPVADTLNHSTLLIRVDIELEIGSDE
jgi:hypothetical protein